MTPHVKYYTKPFKLHNLHTKKFLSIPFMSNCRDIFFHKTTLSLIHENNNV